MRRDCVPPHLFETLFSLLYQVQVAPGGGVAQVAGRNIRNHGLLHVRTFVIVIRDREGETIMRAADRVHFKV